MCYGNNSITEHGLLSRYLYPHLGKLSFKAKDVIQDIFELKAEVAVCGLLIIGIFSFQMSCV